VKPRRRSNVDSFICVPHCCSVPSSATGQPCRMIREWLSISFSCLLYSSHHMARDSISGAAASLSPLGPLFVLQNRNLCSNPMTYNPNDSDPGVLVPSTEDCPFSSSLPQSTISPDCDPQPPSPSLTHDASHSHTTPHLHPLRPGDHSFQYFNPREPEQCRACVVGARTVAWPVTALSVVYSPNASWSELAQIMFS